MGFVTLKLVEYHDDLALDQLSGAQWVWFVSLAVAHAAASPLLAFGWSHVLNMQGLRVSWIWSLATYGRSQIAKYVPGNVVHLASRQSMGVSAGLPGLAIAKSMVWELALVLCAGLLFTPALLSLQWPSMSAGTVLALCASTAALLLGTIGYGLGRSAVKAVGCQAAFLAAMAMIFVALLLTTGDISSDELNVPLVAGAYVVAVLVGLVTPGAPAGIGVREATLLLLLNGQVPPSALLVAALMARAVSVVGDLLFFMGSIRLPKSVTN